MKTIWRRIWLFARIVWRIDQDGYRMSWRTAWAVANTVWPSSRLQKAQERQLRALLTPPDEEVR